MKLTFALPSAQVVSRLTALCFTAALVSCSSTQTKNEDNKAAHEGFEHKEDLYIVDCSLPGTVRRLGNISYVGPRRATRTTAEDCRIRGGEYVEYDRADYRSALKVWLPSAEDGNPEAQNYVGEIYEKGIAGTPDYESAAAWYKKAADKGNSRAQLNLGYLYEKGLGVSKNMAVALNYYRAASDLTDDKLVLNSEAQEALENQREVLNKKIAQANTQTRLLENQLASLESENSSANKQEEVEALKALYDQAKEEKQNLATELASLTAVFRTPSEQSPYVDNFIAAADVRKLKENNFGRFYALIIGNQDYLHLDDLQSPLRDAQRLKEVLEQDYGFKTLVLRNAYEKTILNSLNNFYSQITEKDNLLIFYAGHGEMSDQGMSQKQRGYWLPVDAHSNSISNWINNAVISDHLDRIKARSVMVIADSCYAGGLGSEKSSFLFGISRPNWWNDNSLKSDLQRRARVVISSGGERPVLDGNKNFHSIFTSALIDVLEKNNNPIRDSELFSRIAVDVRVRSEKLGALQRPEMKPIREAGHEGGSFYFIPKQFN